MQSRDLTAPAAAVLLLALLAGCAGPPADNPLLSHTRTDYQQLAADPRVIEHAPSALEEAWEALRTAMAAWEAGASPEIVEHHAYIARQRADIARHRARLGVLQQATRRAGDEQRDLQLQIRTAEARIAEARARTERELAERAIREADVIAPPARVRAGRAAPVEAELTHRGLVFTLGAGLFDPGQARLREGAATALDGVVAFLREHPDRNVLIEGHTDATGAREENLRLSRQRARAVRDALVGRDIPADRIRAVGLGERYPVATNATEAGRQQNRRVEVIISDARGHIPPRR